MLCPAGVIKTLSLQRSVMSAISTSNPINHLEDILAAQRTAFLRDGPPTLSGRRADLKKLRAAILARRNDIEAVLNADFGHRSRHETAIMDVVSVILGIDYLHRNLRRFMRPTRRHVALPFRFGSVWIEYQPLGVIGIVAPWNYPVSLALMPLATAIAAGNRAMIKPSEFTPATSNLLAAMLGDTFPDDQVAVVTGDAAVGAAFSALAFDHVLFTGSTPVGRAVMRAASENLVPVTLELGGKSPVIVQKGYALVMLQPASPMASSPMPGRPASLPIIRWCTQTTSRRLSPPTIRPSLRSIQRDPQATIILPSSTIAITQGSMNYSTMPAVRARASSNPGQSPAMRTAARILSRR
jgi:Aldehyde dehydrogenase family